MIFNKFKTTIIALFSLVISSLATGVNAMQITSSAFLEGGNIPKIYSCDGQNLSPPLAWQAAPANTETFVLIMDDPDAPVGTWDHWILFNIPKEATQLTQGVVNLPTGTRYGANSWHKTNYGGPCPPDREHRYFFKLFALDTSLNLAEGTTKAQVLSAMQGHILAQASLMGKYTLRK